MIKKFLTQIIEGWKSVFYAIKYRFDEYEWWEWDCDFWTEINIGWYQEYIYPYDDWYGYTISKERQLRLAQKVPTVHLSADDFDSLVERLAEPPDPAIMKRVEKILKTPAPWDKTE